MKGFHVKNFGCRATQADGAAIERDLLARGLSRAASPNDAAVVVLNSCTVTAAADADLRSQVRRIHRRNPEARILVTGCYAQRAPEEVAALEGVTWVIGNSHKNEVAGIAASLAGIEETDSGDHATAQEAAPLRGYFETAHFGIAQLSETHPLPSSGDAFVSLSALGSGGNSLPAGFGPGILTGDIFAHSQLLVAPVAEDTGHSRTRPNLKVQDGCDNRCSFCVIPFVRGRSRSLPLAEVLRECRALVDAGYREVVISGINLGRWGRDFSPALKFDQLVRALLNETDLERLRISSVEPMDWSDDLISLVAENDRICKHAHVPLQSGSDRVLRAMHRRYRPWHYAEKLRCIREAMPNAAIGADVMTGFPGETEEMFEESRDLIGRLPFTYLHVFTFSSRPGTAAEKLPGQVPVEVARRRNQQLRELAAEKNLAFRRSFLGQRLELLTLRDGAALSHNFIKVEVPASLPANQLLSLRIASVSDDGLLAAAENDHPADDPTVAAAACSA